jgi:hypothetical protein
MFAARIVPRRFRLRGVSIPCGTMTISRSASQDARGAAARDVPAAEPY